MLPALNPSGWSQRIPLSSGLSIAPDGSVVAGASLPPSGGVATPWAFTAAQAAVPLDGLTDGAVFALAGGMVAVGPSVADAPGPVTIVTPSGNDWTSSRQMVGPVFATSNVRGTRVAVLDNGSSTVRLLQVAADGSIQPLPSPQGLGPGASIQFDDAGDALVAETHHASLFSAGGMTLWSVPVGASAFPQSSVLDRDGRGVTVATSGSDNTLYQFTAPGNHPNVAWSEPLASGGTNHLVSAPDGRVAIGAAGGLPTVAVYREQDGALLWQDSVSTPQGASSPPEIVGLTFGKADGVVLSLTGCDSAGDPCLVLLAGSDGSALGTVILPPAAQVALAADGEAAAYVVTQGSVATLTWLNLSGLWPS